MQHMPTFKSSFFSPTNCNAQLPFPESNQLFNTFIHFHEKLEAISSISELLLPTSGKSFYSQMPFNYSKWHLGHLHTQKRLNKNVHLQTIGDYRQGDEHSA